MIAILYFYGLGKQLPEFMDKICSEKEKKYVQVIYSHLVSYPWPSSKTKRYSIEKSHPKIWNRSCALTDSQKDLLELMRRMYSAKETNMTSYN